METILTNVEELSNRVYHIILKIYNMNRLEQESTYSVILERLKSKSLGYSNIYGGYRYNKRTN